MQKSATKRIGVNESGRRVGEGHHRAKLTDADVDRIRELREEQGATYSQIADWFDVAEVTVRSICRYRHRAQTPARFKGGT